MRRDQRVSLITLILILLGTCVSVSPALAQQQKLECYKNFIRGDANWDGFVDIGDPLKILFYQFRGQPLVCVDAGDANSDGFTDMADAIYLLIYIFRNGSPPKPPFPLPGRAEFDNPTISDLIPTDGTFLTNSLPTLSAKYDDEGVGLDEASIRLVVDGKDVTAQADVNATGLSYPVPAPLGEGGHSMTVRLNDLAGNAAEESAAFTVDSVAPQVSNFIPANNSLLSTAMFIISAEFSDAVSGIDVSSVRISLDGRNITGPASITEGGFSYTIVEPLGDGQHSVTLDLSDRAGNITEDSINFTIDTTPPRLIGLRPVSGSFVADSTPLIAASYGSDVSGIDAGSLQIILDGNNVTAAANASAAGFTLNLSSPLSEGAHSVRVSLRDGVGNETEETIDFTVDSQAPEISNVTPFDGGLLLTGLLLLGADFSDTLSGVDVSTVRIVLDGNDITDDAAITAQKFSYVPTTPLSDGEHVFSIEIQDRAGNRAETSTRFIIDTLPPEISNFTPASGSVLGDPRPLISATFGSDPAGINMRSIQVRLDGRNETLDADISATGFTLRLDEDLADGAHSAQVSLADNVAHIGSAITNFTIDTTAPVISNPAPAHGSLLAASPALSATFADNAAGINSAATQILLDDVDVTAQANVSEAGFDLTPNPPLSDGNHTLIIRIEDQVGNDNAMSISFSINVQPQNVSGNITENTVWTAANGGLYIVTGNVNVLQGNELTVEPGVEVRFDGFYKITVDGLFTAAGTAAQPIKFTSNQSVPAAGDWDSIQLNNAGAQGTHVLRHVISEYAGKGVWANGSSPTIDQNVFRHDNTAIHVVGPAVLNVTNNTLANSEFGLIVVGLPPYPGGTVRNNSFLNNSQFDLRLLGNDPDATFNVEENWWGTTDPSVIIANIFDNVDSTVVPRADFVPFLDGPGGNPVEVTAEYVLGTISQDTVWDVTDRPYIVLSDIVLPRGITLTINPGVEVRFAGNHALNVTGTLSAQGTAAEKIKFTSDKANPAPGDWERIYFTANDSTNAIISHAIIEYAHHGVETFGGTTVVDNCLIQNNKRGINSVNSSESVITNNTFVNNTDRGIHIVGGVDRSGNFRGVINHNSIHNNGTYDLSVAEGSDAIVIDAENNWWGTNDGAVIAARIFDNEDSNGRPFVDYDPFLNGPGEEPVVSNITVSPLFVDPKNNETTNIQYTLAFDSDVTIRIQDFRTGALVRTLIDGAPRPAGLRSETWDGRDDGGQVLPPEVYHFVMETSDVSGRVGGSSPTYFDIDVTMTNKSITPATFNPYAGEVATITYDLPGPAIVTILIGDPNVTPEERTAKDRIAVATLNNVELWDGRRNDGSFSAGGTEYSVFGFAKVLPENAIVIQDRPTLSIGTIRANPYAIYPVYGDVTEIEYSLSESATVLIEIKNPSGVTVRTLVPGAVLAAGTHKMMWDLKDSSGRTVASEGDYAIHVTATPLDGRVPATRGGNLRIFK